jgi:excisionase family DNA binding protein
VSDHLLTAVDLAEHLSVPVSWVREHTRSGHIPHVQLGSYIRYRHETVLTWIGQQEARTFRRHHPQIRT